MEALRSLFEADIEMPPGLSPRFPPPKKPRKVDPGPDMTKDRALIVLGMSSKARKRVGRELHTEVITAKLKEKQSDLNGRRVKLIEEKEELNKFPSLGFGVGEISFQLRLERLRRDEMLLESAANFLIQTIRCDELTRDSSWKPGVMAPREESKWLTFVKPKARTISIINRLIADNKEEETTVVKIAINHSS